MTPKAPKLPDGCASAEEHERRLTQLANRLEETAYAMLAEGSTRIGMSGAKEMGLAAVRARRAAGELARHRELIDHDRMLVDHNRRRLGLESPRARRPKLERVS